MKNEYDYKNKIFRDEIMGNGLNMVKDIRNIGLVAGVELDSRHDKKSLLGRDVFEECFKNGVMVRYTGNTIALSPPLIINESQIDHVFDVLGHSIKKCF